MRSAIPPNGEKKCGSRALICEQEVKTNIEEEFTMALAGTYKKYRVLFAQAGIQSTKETGKYFGRLWRREKLARLMILVPLVIFAVGAYAKAHHENDGSIMGIAGLILIFVTGPLFLIFRALKYGSMADLDNIYFNKFLINSIKIFYNPEELRNFSYEKIRHATVRVANAKNANQPVIELAFMGHQAGAEGILLTGSSSTGVTSGSFNRRGHGQISTTMIDSAEAVFIKDIKEKQQRQGDSTSATIDKNDLGYWHDLLQRGAITNDEYEVKKKELLNVS